MDAALRYRTPRPVSHLELLFAEQVKGLRIPSPERNYRFALPRKYEIDFAWPDRKVGVEIEGGVYSLGAHARMQGIVRDIRKQNYIVLLGWRVLRGEAIMVEDGTLVGLFRLLWVSSKVDDRSSSISTQDVGSVGRDTY